MTSNTNLNTVNQSGQGGRLFENRNVKFIDASSYLLYPLSLAFYKLNLGIMEDRKLRIYARDFKHLDILKEIVNANEGNPQRVIEILSRPEHFEFIKNHDRELAQLIAQFSNLNSQTGHSKNLRDLLGNPALLLANIELALGYAESIPDKPLKEKIKSRLMLIGRNSREIRVLRQDLEDINRLSSYLHLGVPFFVATINGYFNGSKQDERRKFEPLDQFNDGVLKKEVYGNAQIKRMYYFANLTSRMDEQKKLITQFIAGLQSDMQGEVWVRNIQTKKFFEGLTGHARRFKELGNGKFAEYLLAHSQYGEQPNKWIALLKGMMAELNAKSEELIRIRSRVIEDARVSLFGLFESRIKTLTENISKLSNGSLQDASIENTGSGTILKIKKGLDRMEKVIRRLWKERRKKFHQIKIRIGNLSLQVMPKIDELSRLAEAVKEGRSIASSMEHFLRYSRAKQQIAPRVRSNNLYNSFGNLIMINFAAARMDDSLEEVDAAENQIRLKDKQLREYDVAPLAKVTGELLNEHKNLLEWINRFFMATLVTGLNPEKISEDVKSWGEKYV